MGTDPFLAQYAHPGTDCTYQTGPYKRVPFAIGAKTLPAPQSTKRSKHFPQTRVIVPVFDSLVKSPHFSRNGRRITASLCRASMAKIE